MNFILNGSFQEQGMKVGDWVLLQGVTDKYPFRVAYHTSQLIYDSEGCLYPATHTGIDFYKPTLWIALTKNCNKV